MERHDSSKTSHVALEARLIYILAASKLLYHDHQTPQSYITFILAALLMMMR